MRAELAENFIAFCLAFNISLFDWQREDFGEALRREDGRFVHRLSGISVPRGDGKTHATAAAGLWQADLWQGSTPHLDVGAGPRGWEGHAAAGTPDGA